MFDLELRLGIRLGITVGRFMRGGHVFKRVQAFSVDSLLSCFLFFLYLGFVQAICCYRGTCV